MHIDFSPAWKSADRILNQFIALMPNLLLAVAVFVLFAALGSAGKRLVRHFAWRNKKHTNLPLLFGRLAQSVIVILGILIAFSIAAPSFAASDVIKMLGVGGVAIGFAFHDILQNFLAGILLLVHEPFHVGDQITLDAFSGMVEDIQARVTLLRSADGRTIVIPNADLFTHTVIVTPSTDDSDRPRATAPTRIDASLVSK